MTRVFHFVGASERESEQVERAIEPGGDLTRFMSLLQASAATVTARSLSLIDRSGNKRFSLQISAPDPNWSVSITFPVPRPESCHGDRQSFDFAAFGARGLKSSAGIKSKAHEPVRRSRVFQFPLSSPRFHDQSRSHRAS